MRNGHCVGEWSIKSRDQGIPARVGGEDHLTDIRKHDFIVSETLQLFIIRVAFHAWTQLLEIIHTCIERYHFFCVAIIVKVAQIQRSRTRNYKFTRVEAYAMRKAFRVFW